VIFVGDGTLLKNSLQFSLAKSHPVDFVFCSEDSLCDFLEERGLPYKITSEINDERETMLRHLSDNILISVNNAQIFKTAILSIQGLSIYNIHNGLLPLFRGLPEICIIFAILEGAKEYGASLHGVDSGIDTGCCYAVETFSITGDDTFQSVMVKGINACELIYQQNIEKIRANDLCELRQQQSPSRLYSYRNLTALNQWSCHPNFGKATALGVFRLWYTKLYEIIKGHTKTTQIISDN